MAHRDAFYDPWQKEFRGFAFAKKIDRGDDTSPTQVTRMFFHTGAPDDIDNDRDGALDERGKEGQTEETPLKGKVLKQQVTTKEGGANHETRDGLSAQSHTLFQRVENTWQVHRIHNINGGLQNIPTIGEEEVSFVFSEQADTELVELGQNTSKFLRKSYVYDAYGNVTEEKNEGEISLQGDEIYTFTDYAWNEEKWIIDKPSRVLKTDQSGKRIAAGVEFNRIPGRHSNSCRRCFV